MKTKIVYVLVSSESDFYLEQTMISIRSLKINNPEASVTLVVDQKTANNLTNGREKILEDVNDYIKADVPERFTKVQSSRFIKTSLRHIVQGDYLFIDSDTVICDCLSEVDSFNEDLMMVLDLHLTLECHQHLADIKKWAEEIEWESPRYFYNSGVIFCRDTKYTRDFYTLWHNEWLKNCDKGFPRDQPTMCKINDQLGGFIKELEPSWNCQIVENGLNFVNNAKIIHYFSSNNSKASPCPYKLGDKYYYNQLRENNYDVTSEILDLLKNPKSAFQEKLLLLANGDTDFIQSPLIINLKKMYHTQPKLFNLVQGIARIIHQPSKILRQILR